jgi:citrate synthase
MTSDDLQALIAEVLKIPPGTVNDELEYGSIREWDSLSHVNLMLSLETRYGVEIDEDSMVELLTVGAIRDFIRDHA